MSSIPYCKKCLTGRSWLKMGDPCETPGCDGILAPLPEYKDLVDALPEAFQCPRRRESWVGQSFPGPDHWDQFKAAPRDRVCSYCGSLHPEDFLAKVKDAAARADDTPYGAGAEISPSDKGYKIYVHQPGVRNAHEGGIKFYTMHLPHKEDGTLNMTEEQNAEYAKAVKNTQTRFERKLHARQADLPT